MSNPGARFFQKVTIDAEVWVHPNADLVVHDVAERVCIEMQNACDEVAKRLADPAHGIDVAVKVR